ncbi:MAG: hypothetical protein P1P80_05080 [ANME-2 cluster archaeon]|nr:hypothetical protein [ANME-2 cluster archaeon]
MNATFRCMAAAPKEIIGGYSMESIMQLAFSIGKNGDVNLCFGDTIQTDEPIFPEKMTESAYPNNGEVYYGKQGLWLSMFTRHMEEASVVEIEMDE